MVDRGYGTPISKRKRDIFFACCFAFFAFSSFCSDAQHGLGRLHGDGFWARANMWYADAANDQFFKEDHAFPRINTLISGFVWGPFYLVLVYSFVRGWNRVRPWALLYVGGMTHGVIEFMYWEYAIGPPPGNPLVFWAFNAPYVIVPILLGFRMWKPMPFGAATETAGGA